MSWYLRLFAVCLGRSVELIFRRQINLRRLSRNRISGYFIRTVRHLTCNFQMSPTPRILPGRFLLFYWLFVTAYLYRCYHKSLRKKTTLRNMEHIQTEEQIIILRLTSFRAFWSKQVCSTFLQYQQSASVPQQSFRIQTKGFTRMHQQLTNQW